MYDERFARIPAPERRRRPKPPSPRGEEELVFLPARFVTIGSTPAFAPARGADDFAGTPRAVESGGHP